MKVLLVALFVAAVAAVPIPDEDAGAVEMIVNGVAEGEALDIGDIVDIKVKEHSDGTVVATDLLHPYTAVGIAEAVAAAAAESAMPEHAVLLQPTMPEVIPAPVVLPQPAAPEVIPSPVVLPQPAAPEVIPSPVVLPQPAVPEVIPSPVVLPQPAVPEVIPSPVVLPQPAAPEVIPSPVVLPEPAAPEVIPAPVILPEPVAPEVVVPATPEVSPAEVLPSPAAQDNEVYNDGVVSVTVNGPEDDSVLATLQSWFSMVMNYFGSDGAQTTQQIV